MSLSSKLAVAALAVSLTACGGSSSSNSSSGSGGGNNPPANALSGRIVDSPVQGLRYLSSPSAQAGVTDVNGTFGYLSGENVTFSIGSLALGSVPGAAVVTLLDLVDGARGAVQGGATLDDVFDSYPQVLNIARLLQSLDVDGDSSNGIQIPFEASSIAANYVGKLDFSDEQMYASDDKPAVKFICAVKASRGANTCSAGSVTPEAEAKAEVEATEAERNSGSGINFLPNVEVGPDISVVEGSSVSLSGSASDSDGSIASLLWTQTDKNAVPINGGIALTNAETSQASFTAPEVDETRIYYFSLTATDNRGGKAYDVIAVVVKDSGSTVNLPPEAKAGDDLTVTAGDDVILDGAASADSDGTIVSYLWEQVISNNEPAVTLNNANIAQAGFIAPAVDETTQLTFRLTVTDSEGASGSDEQIVTVQPEGSQPENRAPTADAGSAQNVSGGDLVQLAGSGSDPDGDDLTFAWSQLSGTPVDLDNVNQATASFTAPVVDEQESLTFKLTVSDGSLEASSQVTVTVVPQPSCDPTDPGTYSLCFAACTDGDAGTQCPLPYEEFIPEDMPGFEDIAEQFMACADRNPETLCILPIESQPGEEPGVCNAQDPSTYSACFADCTDGNANTACLLPYEEYVPTDPSDFGKIAEQFEACIDQDEATVCILPIEGLPGGGDPGACDATNPASYGACFADCTDGDAGTACPLPYEDYLPDPAQFETVLAQLQACADQDPSTVCPLPLEDLPGGGDPGACDATNPASYGACFADCTDGDAGTACPLPYEDFMPDADQFNEVLAQFQACADQDPSTVCPLPIEDLPGGGDGDECDATNPASYAACFADCTDGDAGTACPLPYEDFMPDADQFNEVLAQFQACADQDPSTVCPLPIEDLPGGGDPGACDATNPASYGACFADCTDGDAGTACPLPYEDYLPDPAQFEAVLEQLQACADQDPSTVCPLPIENLPGGGDSGECDATNPASYGACFADCTDGDAGTACPLPYEDFMPDADQFNEVLAQFQACADQDPSTVCPLPIENLPGGGDPGACDATNPASYSACFADCTDGDAGTACPLPYEDFMPDPDQFNEVLAQFQACADQDPSTVCPLPIEDLPGGGDGDECDATNPASYAACFADCTDGDAGTACPLPYEDFMPDADQFNEVLAQFQACADQDPSTVCPLPIENLPGGGDPGACDATNPASYGACFADCTDGDAGTACPLPYEDFMPDADQFNEVLAQFQACADQDPSTVCPLPIENLPGGGDSGECDATNPASYGACFADCTDGDAGTACPLPYEDYLPDPAQFEAVLAQLQACADQDPSTVCPLPIENLPGGGDPGACDATNPASYGACFADCTDGDAGTACPLPYEDYLPDPAQFETVLAQLQACADQDPSTVCPLPIENLPGGGDPGACDATNPASYGACFADCTDGDAGTACPLPYEDFMPDPDQFNEILAQFQACADQDPSTVCPLPLEDLPGGGDPGACDATNPASYGACFADCTDGDAGTACPLPYEDFMPDADQFNEVLAQFQACADQDPSTVCPLPIENLPGGGDSDECDATNPASYAACFADCTDGDAGTACPLPYEDFMPDADQFNEVLAQFQACADQDPSTVCPLPIENLPGGGDSGECNATNPASYGACFADCTDGDAGTACPLPYEDFMPDADQFNEVLAQFQACADQDPSTVCPLPIEDLPGGGDSGECNATNPASYGACFADCTDGDAGTACPLPYEDFMPDADQFNEVLAQFQACADQDPSTVCPLPIENLPGGGDSGECNATNPASYGACFADCTDGDAGTACPLPYEDFMPDADQFNEVLAQFQACADQDPSTVCPLPIENLPGGGDSDECDATNPASYGACFADCTDGDAGTACPLPYEDFMPDADQFNEVLAQFQACADQDPSTVCPLPIENLPGGGDSGECNATNPASYGACFADCTDGDAGTACPLPYEDFMPDADQFNEVLAQFQACADQDPSTVCPLPIESLPGGDPGECNATDPTTYSACFAVCTDGDAGTACPLPYEDFAPDAEQFNEVLAQLGGCADNDDSTECLFTSFF